MSKKKNFEKVKEKYPLVAKSKYFMKLSDKKIDELSKNIKTRNDDQEHKTISTLNINNNLITLIKFVPRTMNSNPPSPFYMKLTTYFGINRTKSRQNIFEFSPFFIKNIISFCGPVELYTMKFVSKRTTYDMIDWRMIALSFQLYVSKSIKPKTLNNEDELKKFVLTNCVTKKMRMLNSVIEFINNCSDLFDLPYEYVNEKIGDKYGWALKSCIDVKGAFISDVGNIYAEEFRNPTQVFYKKKKGYNLKTSKITEIIYVERFRGKESVKGFTTPEDNLLRESKVVHDTKESHYTEKDDDEGFDEDEEREKQDEFIDDDYEEEFQKYEEDDDYVEENTNNNNINKIIVTRRTAKIRNLKV